MVQTYTSGWVRVNAGDTTSYTVPNPQDPIGAEVRWRGVTKTITERKEREVRYQKRTTDLNPGYLFGTQTLPGPDIPNNGYDVAYSASFRANIEPDTLTARFSAFANQNLLFRREGTDIFDSVSIPQPPVDFGVVNTSEQVIQEVVIEVIVNAKYSIDRTVPSTRPAVVLNSGDRATVSRELSDGEITDWCSIDGFAGQGQNDFAHNIASGDVEFQFRYTYSTGDAVPTPISASPTTASIADETIVATPTPISAEPLAALVNLPGGNVGWTAALETGGGETRYLGSDAVTSIGIQPEYNAAWGAIIGMPPIIDPDDYRGGSFRLWHNGALQLRCPTIAERKQASDGTLTIGGLGPASGFQEMPVDRVFENVLGTDAIETLLREDGGLAPGQITIYPPPDDPVVDEVVQSASTRETFGDVLLERTRNDAGQFVAEQGGTAPNWQPTDPLAWAYDELGFQGVETTQTLQFREAESFASGVSAATTTVAGASGEQVVEFGTDTETRIEFSIQFEHTVPEGELGLSIRAKSESMPANGPTTLRVKANDHELATFFVDDFNTGQGFSWLHFDTDFVPGGDGFTLSIDTTQAGENRLDMDCVAVYDDRYSYDFDNQTDANDALAGPEEYPDAAPLHFQSAPVGLALDSATVTATFDVAGDADTVGVEATGGGRSSSETITGTSGMHTEQFAATTPGVRPLVSLSRTTTPQTETPTTGNAPQTLMAVETSVTGNAIPVIGHREFEATNVFDALQSLCEDYGLVFTVEHGRERGYLSIEVFQEGDPRLRRELPTEAVVTDASESAEAQNYANVVTVKGREIENGRVTWTEKSESEIQTFGREVAPPIINDDLETINDVRSVARAELKKRLDEDERGGSLETTPALVEPGYPYHIPVWDEYPDAPGWGEGKWGEFPWGSPQAYATLESASFSESAGDASASLDFSIRSDLLAVLSGGL